MAPTSHESIHRSYLLELGVLREESPHKIVYLVLASKDVPLLPGLQQRRLPQSLVSTQRRALDPAHHYIHHFVDIHAIPLPLVKDNNLELAILGEAQHK